jgi:excisionase family DNA binding protein
MIEVKNVRLLTAAEAAEHIGVTPQQVRTLIRQGKLIAEKHGRDWYVREADVLKFERMPAGRPQGAKDSKPRKTDVSKAKMGRK